MALHRLCLGLVLLLATATPAWPHAGGRDIYGCHNNNTLVVYECHVGQFAGRSWPNPGGKDAMLAELNPVAPLPPELTAGAANLVWNANTEVDLAGYKVYVGTAPGVYCISFISTEPMFSFATLSRGKIYYFAVTAFDNAGNESAFSNEVSKAL